MGFGKRTDDVIGSVPNNPKIPDNIIMGGKGNYNAPSYKEKILKKFELKKDSLFDEFENDEDIDFLSFDSEGFIPIEEDFEILKSLFLDSNNEISVIISNEHHDADKFLFTSLNDSNVNELLTNFDPSEIYLTIGFLNFNEYSAPLFFVPVILNEMSICRDSTKDIKFNYFLENELKLQYKINLPKFNSNIEEFIEKLKEFENFEISNKSYLGNFYFRKLLLYNDLDLNNWNNLNKIESFFDNSHIYSIGEFRELNDNIAKEWPSLNLKYNKDVKIKGADKLIINLLSQGNSILYVSNYYSKKEVIKSLKNSHLNSLILDFNYNSTKYSIFEDIINSDLQLQGTKSTSDLLDQKIFYRSMIRILDKKYSSLNLTPLDMYKKKEEFSEYNNEINMDFDEVLHNFDDINEDIKKISKSTNLINIVVNTSESINFSDSDYKHLKNVYSDVRINLEKFRRINQNLNEKYGLLIFGDLSSPQYLENFNYISEQSKYIDAGDYVKLNEFLKVNYEYQNLKNDGNNLFLKKRDEYINRIINQKINLENFNDQVDEINSITKYLDMSSVNFEDNIKYLLLLSKDPALVEDEEDLRNIVKIIEKYQNEKKFKGKLVDKLQMFWNDHEVFNEILNEYKRFINDNSKNLSCYNNINLLSYLFSDSGFNFKTLTDYFILKDELPNFKNAKYIENEDYFTLNDNLKEFLESHENYSIDDYLKDINSKYELVLNGLKDIIRNRYSIVYKQDLFNNINQLLEIQRTLGFNFNNFEELVEYEEFIKYLDAGPIFDSNFSDNFLEDHFEVINGLNISNNVRDYINSKIEEYVSVMNDIIDLSEEYLKNNYELDYIKNNIQEIIDIKDEIGINLDSLNDLRDNINILDILIKNPQLNYDIEDYERYLTISKTCQKYETEDIYELLDLLDKEFKETQQAIKNELNPIFNAEYELIFIRDKLNDIQKLINNLSKLSKCNAIEKFNDIDKFISNLEILKYNPSYIENYDDEFDTYIETIDFLDNVNLLDEDYLNECNNKLVELNDLDICNQISELKNIIEICYKNDTSLGLLNLKKDLLNFVEKIKKQNIKLEIIDNLDIDECIESLKPNYNKISSKNSKKVTSKFIINEINEEHPKFENISDHNGSQVNNNLSLKNYTLESKNSNLNNENINNNFYRYLNNNPIYDYLKDKNVSNKKIIDDLESLKESINEFNELQCKLSDYINSNLEKIKEFSVKEELYHTKIERILKRYCPNSFNGIKSDINNLNREFQLNKSFTRLVDEGFFKEKYYTDFSFDKINPQIIELKKSKNDLLEICGDKGYATDDSFNDILEYLDNLLNDIKSFKDNEGDIFSLNYLKELISKDNLLDLAKTLKDDITIVSNLEDDFINKYFNENYGLKVKENIKLVDEFNQLIKSNIFTDKTINFLENSPKTVIEKKINTLKINIEILSNNLINKEFNLDDSLNSILIHLNKLLEENYSFKSEINENSYYLKFIDFDNYMEFTPKFISFINKHLSKLNITNQVESFKNINLELDTFNEIYSNESYGKDLFNFTQIQINNELLKLKNNLIFNNLVKKGYISNNLPKNTSSLIKLIDETKILINENDYNVTFEELIEDNTNINTILNEFEEKYDNISKKWSNRDQDFLNIIYDIENLFNEYSVPFSNDLNELKKNISDIYDLYNLIYSLDMSLLNYSETELVKYVENMELNKKFTDLINSNIFSDKVCKFYEQNFNDKLEEMEYLSRQIVNSINEQDLDKSFPEIINSEIENVSINYSNIIKLMKKDSNNSKELIDNISLILDRTNNLLEYNILDKDYSQEILKIKHDLDNLSYLYDLEQNIQSNIKLIEKHFNKFLSVTPILINDLYEKIEIDLKFTKYYNEGIFSNKTIENIKNLPELNLSFDNSIFEFYNSKDYLKIYENNKFLIEEISNYENGLIDKDTFLGKANEVLNNENIEKLLKLDISSQLNYYESQLSSLNKLREKYIANDDYVLQELKSHLAFTELVDNNIFEDKKLIKSNLKEICMDLDDLNNIYYLILRDICIISDFYKNYNFLELDQNSFNYTILLDKLEENLERFEKDLDDLNEINNLDSFIISFIRQVNAQNINLNNIYGIFNYNIYNYLLNKFYEDFPEMKNKDLNYNNYLKKLKSIDKQISKDKFDKILTEIYGNIHEKRNEKIVVEQKASLTQKITNKSIGTIKETLNEYKEYIINEKRVFMMDIRQFYEYISNQFESEFDYIILDKNFEFEELDTLALYFRSKNKLIDLR